MNYICIEDFYFQENNVLFKKNNQYLIYENDSPSKYSHDYKCVSENGLTLFFDKDNLRKHFISLSEYRENKLNEIL